MINENEKLVINKEIKLSIFTIELDYPKTSSDDIIVSSPLNKCLIICAVSGYIIFKKDI